MEVQTSVRPDSYEGVADTIVQLFCARASCFNRECQLRLNFSGEETRMGHEKSATAERIVNSVAYLAGPGKVTDEVLLVGGSARP
jgi:hypothetical protein